MLISINPGLHVFLSENVTEVIGCRFESNRTLSDILKVTEHTCKDFQMLYS